jgi:hypothetical protein
VRDGIPVILILKGNVSIFILDMKFLIIVLLSLGSCMLGCCSANKSQEESSLKETGISGIANHGTVQRYSVTTISAIIESLSVVDTALYRLYVRTVSTASEGEESITPGQLIELLPHYVYNDHSLIDWSIEINRKLRSVRDAHPGSPVQGKVMIDQAGHWLLVGIE